MRSTVLEGGGGKETGPEIKMLAVALGPTHPNLRMCMALGSDMGSDKHPSMACKLLSTICHDLFSLYTMCIRDLGRGAAEEILATYLSPLYLAAERPKRF